MNDHYFIKRIDDPSTESHLPIWCLMILTQNGILGYYGGYYEYKEARNKFRQRDYKISACYTRYSDVWNRLKLENYFPQNLYPK
jgi:hypothetical protein